ncbi:MAG: TonB-dependent receptor [Prevotellaceae bacterium]|jgi:outer membrane receptor protein involved in Fe transport|nr:TonB-dependent receptor [Prevotellaceae bacterium]
MKSHYTAIFIAGLMLCISNAVVAQQSSKTKKNAGLGDPTVEVVTDYEGKILETDKIDIKYNTGDSLIYPKIIFSYPFITHDMQSSFSLEPIPAISMAIDNLTMPDMGYGYLRAAFLHPLTPEADFYLHNPLSKKSAVSIYLKHRSFWGKSPLYDQAPLTSKPVPDEILSEHETSSAGVVMQHHFKYAAIDVKAEYKHQSLLYYGQDTLFLKENIDNGYTGKITENSYVRKFMRQTFNIVNADARIYSLDNVNKTFSFSIQGYFDYLKESAHRFLSTKPVNQHTVGVNSFFNFRISTQHVLNLQLYAKTYNRDNLSKHFTSGLFNAIPSYAYRDDIMKASAGLNIESIYNGYGLNYNFYPFLAFHFIAYNGLFIPFLEITGGSTLNNYEKITSENPYVLPGLDVSNTRTRIKGEAGVRGSFSSIFAYCLKASYSMIDSMYFFVNSTEPINDRGTINPSTALLSNFDVVYDNISKISVGFELSAKHRNIDVLFFANYTKYNMDKEEKSWHKPAIEAGLQSRYKLKPLNFILDALYRGETPVLLPAAYAAHTTSTKSYINLGFTVEYRITENFSIFLQGKNLLNQPCQDYYLYYHPGMTVGGGLTHSF